ncbi:N-acetylneuraminate synthase (EC [Olavius sp. associated proteobacterium Delta 1]|nr:N-acetylneuraminate synthase (EC [Olavius sp. associated proteobacterium Delta 1]
MKFIKFGNRQIGEGYPIFIIAEIGINHNGDLNIAKMLIDAAVDAGCDAVKFQKRTPELCVPTAQQKVIRKTPWGTMTYLQYRQRVEFDQRNYADIDSYCKARGITWFASCWDEPSVDFMEQFSPPFYKIASACLTDDNLLQSINVMDRPMILSTGMSTMEEICHAVSLLDMDRLLIAHTTSSYIFRPGELNLRMIHTLQKMFDCPIGYSGHEDGVASSLAAVTLGASFLERHITLDRGMWGSDQKISLVPEDLKRLVVEIRMIEEALGDGVKRLYDSEKLAKVKLRKYRQAP